MEAPDIHLQQESEDVLDLPENVDLVDLIDQPAWKTILIQLVKKEHMDPWDIDVVDLAEKYLTKIHALEKADLRVPANAILAASILLRLKAKTIKLSSLEEWEEDEEEKARKIAEQQLLFSDDNIPDLHGGRMTREGAVSLDELVLGIQDILEKTKQKAAKKRALGFEIPEFNIPLGEKDIESRTEDILARVKDRSDSTGVVRFSQLLNEKHSLEMVQVFVPLLFLANKGELAMWQEAFWGEVFVSLNPE